MWDPVPWMVGGGAEHSVNVARNVAYAAFNGRPGLVNPTDCEVRELTVPGASVQVYPGTVAILNRATGAKDEMYVGRLPEADIVNIAATDATGPRSDLIIARVENPYASGEPWNKPTDPKVGPYIFSRVISNVPANTASVDELGLGYSAFTLARIDIPVSTGAITQAMIKDLRTLSSVYNEREFNIVVPSAAQSVSDSGVWHNWPTAANMSLTIPSWATHVKLRAILSGITHGASGSTASNMSGQLRMALQGATGTIYGSGTYLNLAVSGGIDKTTLMTGAPSLAIPTAYRGKAATVKIEGVRDGTSSAGSYFSADHGSIVSIEAEFVRMGESNV